MSWWAKLFEGPPEPQYGQTRTIGRGFYAGQTGVIVERLLLPDCPPRYKVRLDTTAPLDRPEVWVSAWELGT